MAPIKFSLISTLDIIAGVFLYFTESFVPTGTANIHAGFLIFKGTITQFPIPPFPPIFVVGAFADIISAAIVYTGTPPLLGGYKEFIAFFLLQKGILSALGMMSM